MAGKRYAVLQTSPLLGLVEAALHDVDRHGPALSFFDCPEGASPRDVYNKQAKARGEATVAPFHAAPLSTRAAASPPPVESFQQRLAEHARLADQVASVEPLASSGQGESFLDAIERHMRKAPAVESEG